MGDSCAGIRPFPLIKVQELVGDHLLKVAQPEFFSWGPIHLIEGVSVDEAQLQQIKDGFLGPPIGPPGNGVVIDQLIKGIYAAHVVDVLPDDFRALQGDLLICESVGPFYPPAMNKLLRAGVERIGDEGHEADVLPTDDSGVSFPSECHLTTLQLLLLLDFLQHLGRSPCQPQRATYVRLVIIKLIRKLYRIVIVVHEDVIAKP